MTAPSTAVAPLLDVQSISRSFGKVDAVRDLSFRVHPGQVFGFIGPNGAGKTTTMRIIATLDLPDAGDARVEGHSVLAEPREVCARLGFMADRFQPYPNLSVAQFLDFMARAYGLRGRTRRHTVSAVTEFCGLAAVDDRPATGLSKGMGQRLHLAKTLLHDPKLLVLDEPAAGLDPRARVEFRDLVRELARSGKGILISSHLLSELSEVCDGVVVIEQGRLVVEGGIRAIAKNLKEHRAIRVRADVESDRVERFLLTQPQVHTVVGGAEGVMFDFAGDDAELADLLKRLVVEGIPVHEFRHVEADLEEIFLRATEGRLQ